VPDEVSLTGKVHSYRSHLEWAGATGDGYQVYDRAHRLSSPPAQSDLNLSSDPSFHGDPDLLTPEQLLLAAASSCQLLAFLAVVARARINVVSYSDEAEAVMPEDDKPMRITRITLRPRVVIEGDADESRVRHYIDLAHQECFIANTLSAEMTIEPRVEFR